MVLSVFDDWYSVPFVKNTQKTVKTTKMTIGVPIVTCLHRVRRIHKAVQTPLPCETSITRAWAVAKARRPWAGLTVIRVAQFSVAHFTVAQFTVYPDYVST